MQDRVLMEERLDGILRYGLANDDLAGILRTACEALVEAGVPVWRASLDIPTIDPNARAMAHKWWSDRPLSIEPLPHGPEREGVFREIVIYYVMSRPDFWTEFACESAPRQVGSPRTPRGLAQADCRSQEAPNHVTVNTEPPCL